jgi:flagellar basal body rod protein FlgG
MRTAAPDLAASAAGTNLMPETPQSPQYNVSDACISFTETLITCRSSVVSVDDANSFGQDLYSWFKGQGAIDPDKAPFAVRSVGLGKLTLQKSSVETVEEAVQMIKDTYEHYTAGLETAKSPGP